MKRCRGTWASSSLHSCLAAGGWADCAGGQCKPSVRPLTERSGVRPSVISKARETRNSSASYSKYSSKVSAISEREKILTPSANRAFSCWLTLQFVSIYTMGNGSLYQAGCTPHRPNHQKTSFLSQCCHYKQTR